MNLMKAIAIFITGILSLSVIDCFVVIAPLDQTTVDVVLIGVDESSRTNGLLNQRFDGQLLHIFQHLNDDLSTPLEHAQDRRFFLGQGSSASFAFEPTSTAGASLTDDDLRMTFVTSNQVDLITLDLTFKEDGLFFSTTPLRN